MKRKLFSKKQNHTQRKGIKPKNHAPLERKTASINQLPSEILSIIFERYVWGLRRTPFALLSVSRLWYNLVDNTPSLWGNIFLGNTSLSRFCYGTIQCRNLDAFNSAIQKTKNATFQLTIDLQCIDFTKEQLDHCMENLEANWFSRCRALNLCEWGDSGVLLDSLSTFNFNGLQRLCIGWHGHGMWHLLHRVFGKMEQTAETLTSLEIRPEPALSILGGYPKLLSRLTFLDIRPSSAESVSGLWEHLSKVKTIICWSDIIPCVEESDRLLPCATNLTLWAENQFIFPRVLCSRLTHLTVRTKKSWNLKDPIYLVLPELTFLKLYDQWIFAAGIEAPQLRTLVLRDLVAKEFPFSGNKVLEGVRVRPKILHVDIAAIISEEYLVPILNDTWSSLEELRVTYAGQNVSMHTALVDALLGKRRPGNRILPARSKPICPSLLFLSVVMPRGSPNQVDNVESDLRKLVAERRSSGGSLHVRSGWVCLPPELTSYAASHGWYADVENRDKWPTEWKSFA
ncbi:hypothetical protein FRC17_004933 [Serendipita sp. 399]|nr:hypothetical protein FRC17_004933 [Serendipita sp. 399]